MIIGHINLVHFNCVHTQVILYKFENIFLRHLVRLHLEYLKHLKYANIGKLFAFTIIKRELGFTEKANGLGQQCLWKFIKRQIPMNYPNPCSIYYAVFQDPDPTIIPSSGYQTLIIGDNLKDYTTLTLNIF